MAQVDRDGLTASSAADAEGIYIPPGATSEDIAAVLGSNRRIVFSAGAFVLSKLAGQDAAILISSLENLEIVGAGRGATVLALADGQNANVIQMAGSTNISIRGLTVDGNASGQTLSVSGIRGSESDGVTLDDLIVTNTAGYGIGMQALTLRRARFTNLDVSDTGSDGIDVKNTSDDNADLFMDNVTVKRWGLNQTLTVQAGIDVRGPWNLTNITVAEPGKDDCHGIRFREGELEDPSGLGAHDSTITGFNINMGDASAGLGLSVAARDVTAVAGVSVGGQDGADIRSSGFTAVSCTFGGSDDGANIQSAGTNAAFVACRFRANASGVRADANNTKLLACDFDCAEAFEVRSGADNFLCRDADVTSSSQGGRINSGATNARIVGGRFDNVVLDGGSGTIIRDVSGLQDKIPRQWVVLGSSNTAISHTGTTARTVLAAVAVPPGYLNPGAVLRTTVLWTHPNSASNKTQRVYFGNQLVSSNNSTTSETYQAAFDVYVTGAATQKVSQFPGLGAGVLNAGLTALSVDTTAAQNLTIEAILANASETTVLESYRVEVLRA